MENESNNYEQQSFEYIQSVLWSLINESKIKLGFFIVYLISIIFGTYYFFLKMPFYGISFEGIVFIGDDFYLTIIPWFFVIIIVALSIFVTIYYTKQSVEFHDGINLCHFIIVSFVIYNKQLDFAKIYQILYCNDRHVDRHATQTIDLMIFKIMSNDFYNIISDKLICVSEDHYQWEYDSYASLIRFEYEEIVKRM